ncbi:MAG: extracellular solute-binding protein [Alphaproteobacteria bacterium]
MNNTLTAAALGAALIATGLSHGFAAEPGQWIHATSLLDDPPKYAEGFAHFDYVNPEAPKAVRVRMSDTGTFDSLNFVPPRGATPLGLGLIYDSLMTSSMDEVSTEYGLLAEALTFPDDFSSVTYRLRAGATWHDGTPVTAEDVVFSFNVLTEHNPSQAFYYRHVAEAAITGEREVTFTFDQTGNRELPHIVGQLLVLPKHFWEGKDAEGNQRDISRSTLESPLGSGPYRIKSVTAGRSITYERVPAYWGGQINVNVGLNNLDEIRYEYFRDETVELEAFKAGDIDWRTETTARVWATGYDFGAVDDGRVVREMFEEPYRSSGLMVGFVFNLARAPFDDPRVRRAFNYAFPYEDINETIFFSQYTRLKSYFDGIPLASSGLPEGRELELLEEIRDLVPPATFTESFVNPVTDNASERNNLRAALALLREAGWTLDGNELVNADGKQLEVEFLMNGPLFEKIALRYQTQLEKIGINFTLRPADTSQFQNRVRSRDFDIIYTGWAQSMSPGNEQIDYFGSESAAREGSRNYGGVADPAIDALIAKIIQAPDRGELVVATRALDRVLLANHYLVPGWTLRASRIAHWDRYDRPDPLPEFAVGFPTIWWWDEARAAEVEDGS